MSSDTPVVKKSNKLLIALLTLSVAFNLLLVGIWIGRILYHPEPTGIPNQMGWIVRNLDSPTREKVMPKMREHFREAMPLRREVRKSQFALGRLLVADEFDEDAITKAYEKLEDDSSAMQRQMHEQMVNVLKELTVEERKKIIQSIARSRGPDGPNGPGERRPPPPRGDNNSFPEGGPMDGPPPGEPMDDILGSDGPPPPPRNIDN